MKKKLVLRVFAAVALSLHMAGAIAAPSCTNWMKQNDGSSWRTCVDDKGKQYCESSKNGRISRVKC